MPAVALHAAAFIFWLGALPVLAERAARADGGLLPALRRFSAIAVPLVAGLVASGAVLAILQLRHSAELLDDRLRPPPDREAGRGRASPRAGGAQPPPPDPGLARGETGAAGKALAARSAPRSSSPS